MPLTILVIVGCRGGGGGGIACVLAHHSVMVHKLHAWLCPGLCTDRIANLLSCPTTLEMPSTRLSSWHVPRRYGPCKSSEKDSTASYCSCFITAVSS